MSQKTFAVAWKNCSVCEENFVFKSPREFCDHLRDFHCTREGGSFVCQYGHNKICLSLPLEGVSDQDYEDHVARDHVADAGKREIFQRHSRNSSNNSAIIFGNNEPSVVQDQFKWTVYMASVNLSAVLNDPRLGKRDTAIFSKTWGEGFERVAIKPSHLQYITYEHFKTYTDNTAVRHNKHIQNQSILPVEYIDQDKLSEFVPPRLKHNDTGQSEIDAIPKLFLNPTFSLENPTTFNNVLPWSHLEQHGRRSSKLLQEKLSHYLDIVEVQLARQISQRSESFFSVMSSQHELEDYLSRTCCSIKELREKLKQIDAKLVNGPLKMLKSSKQRSNYVKLHNKLKLMSTVHQTQPTLQLLLSTNEFVGALDLIATTQEVLTQELPGVHCFRHLSSQLSEMEKVIVKMMEEDFISYVTGDLNRPLHSERSAIDEERLVSITLGMLRQHKFSFMDIYKEEAVTAIKATLVQTVVEAVADIDADTTSGGLAYQMRLLDYDQWMNLLLKLFENLMIMLQRIKYISSSILEVCQSASCASVSSMTSNERSMASHDGTKANCQNIPNQCSNHSSPIHNGAGDQNGPVDNGDISGYIGNEDESDRDDENYDDLDTSVPTTPISSITATFITDSEITIRRADYLTLYRNIHEMLGFLCDNVHERCSKVLTARAKDGFLERLSSAEFLLLSRSIEEFTSRCEQVAGKRSTALRSCLQSQANRYVNKFHEERKIKLSLIIDNERWKQADVPPDFQALVDHIENTGSLSLPKKSATTRSKSSECIIVSNESYAVVGTVLMLWKMIVEYCQCLDDIPASAPDLLTKLVELLQTFNSRTCQLILGAGALQLVGLKTITARNLALASRCLQLILHYLPTIRKHFEQYLTPKQSTQLKHFNNIIRDYEHHIAEVSSKFQSIMDNSFDKFLEKWEIKPPMPSPCFKNICDRFKKFYESINDLLPPAQMARLVLRIHESLKSKLRVHLIRLCVLNDGGPQHGLVTADIAYYTDQMKSLPGLAQTNDDMSSIWDKT